MNKTTKVFFRGLILVCLVFSICGCAALRSFKEGFMEGVRGPEPKKTEDQALILFDDGVKAYEKGLYETARNYFEQIIEDYPESSLVEVALYYQGGCYKNTGQNEMAVSAYRQLIMEYKYGFWVDAAKKELAEVELTM
ncbi:MAG: tetratricopeptide repeat protein [Candidatus Omnitrophica bacterium]|nr:tetratricopeptide repeat protein [Candidatus Omnitrophota bacterium]